MEYAVNYRPPSQHILVAPTEETSLSWSPDGRGRRKEANFSSADLILNPSGCFTRPQWDRETSFILVAVQPKGVIQVCDELEIRTAEVPERFHFRNGALLRAIQRLMMCFDVAGQPMMKAREMELTLIRSLVSECENLRDGNHRLSKSRLEAVHAFVLDRLSSTITLEEMAKVAGYSNSRFLLLFRNTMGFSPHQYVMRERIEKARVLLARTRLPLSHVATDCGFSDQSHLARLFKRHTGMTPHQWRCG